MRAAVLADTRAGGWNLRADKQKESRIVCIASSCVSRRDSTPSGRRCKLVDEESLNVHASITKLQHLHVLDG